MAGNGVELVWDGKRRDVERVPLPFQRVEIINESRASRQSGPLFRSGPQLPPDPLFDATGSGETPWRNKLIWGDNKYVLASLIEGDPSIGLEPLAGKVDLIYIDPPFATGADFSFTANVGDGELEKLPSAVEEVAYRDTWGQGADSYLSMIYERLLLARDLLMPEQVVVIEHTAFKDFWKKELQEEGLEIEWVPVEQVRPLTRTVVVDKTRLQYDIEVPILTPALVRSVARLDKLNVDDLDVPVVQLPTRASLGDDRIHYTGREMFTMEVVEEADFDRQFPVEPSGYLSVLVKLIERETRLTGQFARLAPLLKQCIESRLFGETVSLEDEMVMRVLNRPDIKKLLFGLFVVAINALSIEEQRVALETQWLRASETNAFSTTRRCVEGARTVFNLVPCDSQLEIDFATFLEGEETTDVLAYFKNETACHFDIEYQGVAGGLRRYRPDFIVRAGDGTTYIVETKGQEDLEVERKDLRAARWCADASALTPGRWQYLKVPEGVFRAYPVRTFADLIQLLTVSN